MRSEELMTSSLDKLPKGKMESIYDVTYAENGDLWEESLNKLPSNKPENSGKTSTEFTRREELIDAINHSYPSNEKNIPFDKKDMSQEKSYVRKETTSSKKITSIDEVERLKNMLMKRFRFINIEKRALYVFYAGYFQLLDKESAGMFFKQVFEDMSIHVVMKRAEYIELLEQLKLEPSLYVAQESCPTNEDVIVFENGTLNVRTFEFSHDFYWQDFQFNKIHYKFPERQELPEAEAEQFLDTFCDYNREKRLYLWELIGYLLSNYNKKIIVVFYGPGNSGKSTLAGFVKRISGSNECVGLGIKELAGAFNLAELQGKRLCIDSEMDATVLNATDIRTVKCVCGNDLILGNRKYERQFYFVPTAKLLWCTNNPIVVRSSEDLTPLLSRLRFFELTHSITPDEWIQNLDLCLDNNRGYFLWCAMQGLHRLVNNNFVFNFQVSASDLVVCMGNSYMENANIAEFVDFYCELDEDQATPIGELYTAYLEYANELNKSAYSNKAFSQYLVNNCGLKRKRSKDERLIVGIRLLN